LQTIKNVNFFAIFSHKSVASVTKIRKFIVLERFFLNLAKFLANFAKTDLFGDFCRQVGRNWGAVDWQLPMPVGRMIIIHNHSV